MADGLSILSTGARVGAVQRPFPSAQKAKICYRIVWFGPEFDVCAFTIAVDLFHLAFHAQLPDFSVFVLGFKAGMV